MCVANERTAAATTSGWTTGSMCPPSTSTTVAWGRALASWRPWRIGIGPVAAGQQDNGWDVERRDTLIDPGDVAVVGQAVGGHR